MKYLKFLLILCGLSACSVSEKASTKDEILWDSYGVPHIYASSDSNLYYMAGWAQMKNHGDLILKLYGEARGVSAELWGDGFEVNKNMHHLGIIDQLETSYENLAPKYQQMLSSFADGVNAYTERHRSSLNEEYLKILPVRETDLIAHYFRIINYEFLIKGELQAAQRLNAGSNAWTISGKKTSTGNAMLVANPHLWWAEPMLWHEQQLITDDHNLYGVSLVGQPSIVIGFNENVSWTHTVNPMDNTDFYEVKKKGNSYYLDGEYLPFEESSYTVKELKEDGTIVVHELTRRKTRHGVVITDTDDTAIAMRFAQMDGYTPFLEQYHLMGKAKNLDEFNEALSLRQMPFLNTLYADKSGNIMHHFGGLIPKKNGDWNKWQDVVPGDSSVNIWTRYYESNELPMVVNPPGGWLQNANEPPFLNTVPRVLNAEHFASHVTPEIEGRFYLRPQRSARLLHENDNISFDELVALKHDNKAEFALRIQDDLVELKRQTSDSLVLAAIETITDWDATYDSQSSGAIFFMEFVNTWATQKAVSSRGLLNVGFEKQWTIDDPLKTPDDFKNPEEMIGILKTAAQMHLEKYPSLEVLYGDYYRLKRGKYEYAATGGNQSLGIFRILSALPDSENKDHFTGFFGDSFVMVVEMGENIKAKGLLSYGNSSNPDSPHYGDQLELFSKNELRDIWFDRASQEQHLLRKECMERMN
ncbi:penicillin acylase family protein [Flagellimonas sp.]|uniref:penicillin acylase family protein n=1 Tax=Flagellimonas sp. TaxID=2058762 RepID=UPI003F4A2AE8